MAKTVNQIEQLAPTLEALAQAGGVLHLLLGGDLRFGHRADARLERRGLPPRLSDRARQ